MKNVLLARPLRLLVALALLLTPLLTTAGDWPSYLHDGQGTAASGDETTLSPSNAGHLAARWAFKTGGKIASSPTVVNGVVYVGSWDGYEYALNATTGALAWKTYLGVTSAPNCNPTSAGVTSVAAVQNGVVYVGGGDAYWYALDASTGAVLWKVYTGDNSASGGHYNWASPLLSNGYAYIGIASFGDCPLVQGQLLRVSLSTHQVVNTYNFVPSGQAGAGIWTSPTIDAASNTVYVTTGTQVGSQPLAQAIVALDAATLTLKGSWQIPAAQAIGDSDWGTTPLVFDDATGTHLVAAADKNGYLYAYDRTAVTAGPLWQQKIGNGGSCPQCGDGMASSGAVANGRLYYASGPTTINGSAYPGAVRALDPATGAYLWEHGSPALIVPAIADANGLIVDGAGSTLEVLDASTGALLYSYVTGGTTLAVLGAATNGPLAGTGTITYGDGSTQSFTLSLPDWTLNAGGGQLAPGGAQLAATMPYRNGGGGKQTLQTDVFYAAITLQAGKAVARVTLPAAPTQGGLHVFALTVAGAASSPPATATSTPPALPASTSTSTPASGTASGSISLSSAYNNVGISDDSSPAAANLDGVGYSYSAQALQAAGFGQGQSVTVNGVAFQWPAAAAGTADNVTAQGQTLTLATPVGGTTLAVLGAATNGPSTGTGTITYSDGSTQSFTLGFSDWTLNGTSAQPSAGNSVAATMPYRNGGGGKQTLQTDVFYTAITLQAGKAVARVTLPASANQGHLHVFAMTVSGTASSPTPTATSTPPPLPATTSTPSATSAPAATALFATGFESGDPRPTWANTVDGGSYPAGGISNVGGICCGLSGPEAGVRTEAGHTGAAALLYSGMDTSASSSYAYDKVFDLTGANIVVGPTTTLSYWIYPQSSATAPEPVGTGNSACVAIDLIFADGSNLRDSGAVDQAGNRLHPLYQCGHLTPDTWNHVTSVIGAVTSGKTIVRLDVGYDQPANTGGYRGYIDDISIHN